MNRASLRIHRPWRSLLDRVPAPELIFPEERPVFHWDPVDADSADRPSLRNERALKASPEETTLHFKTVESLLDNDTSGEDLKIGRPNYDEAFFLGRLRSRRVARTLAIIVSKIAEDLAGWPLEGDDEWNMEALMQRRITRRPLLECRQSREKESLILILDTSGSCLPQAKFYNSLAGAAVTAGDLELYAAPNAGLRARLTRNGWEPASDVKWPFLGRTIVFFGDFDGGDEVVRASWKNKVFWFCSEGDRYPSMDLHPWCKLSMREFRGHFHTCWNESDFIGLMKKVR